MRFPVQGYLSAEALVFGVASLVHAGMLVSGYEHREARIAEGVIAAVLVAGLVGTFIAPQSSRTFGLGAQGFALLGTMVGLFTIAIGVGPRTVFDLTLHAAMVALLVSGLVATSRTRSALTAAGYSQALRARSPDRVARQIDREGAPGGHLPAC